MSAAALLLRARDMGVALWVEGDGLAYDGPEGPLTDDLLAELRRHKPELLELLQRDQAPPWSDDPAEAPGGRMWSDDPEPVPPVTERPDVCIVVEDLADASWRPGRIARTLGLHRNEVIEILRRTGR